MRRAERDAWAALGSTSRVGSTPHEFALRMLADVTGGQEPELDDRGVVVGTPGRLDRRPSMSERLGVSHEQFKRGGPSVNALANVAAAGRRLVGYAWIDVRGVWSGQGERTLHAAARGKPDGLYRTVLDRRRRFYVLLEVEAWTSSGAHVSGLDYTILEAWPGLPGAIVNGLIFPVVAREGGWEVSAGSARRKKVPRNQRVSRIRADLTVWEAAA